MNNTEDLTSRIEFIESHIGGNNDDSVNTFKEQKELIDKNTTDYARLIDYYNKLDASQNEDLASQSQKIKEGKVDLPSHFKGKLDKSKHIFKY